jgi:hypothetical protein
VGPLEFPVAHRFPLERLSGRLCNFHAPATVTPNLGNSKEAQPICVCSMPATRKKSGEMFCASFSTSIRERRPTEVQRAWETHLAALHK